MVRAVQSRFFGGKTTLTTTSELAGNLGWPDFIRTTAARGRCGRGPPVTTKTYHEEYNRRH